MLSGKFLSNLSQLSCYIEQFLVIPLFPNQGNIKCWKVEKGVIQTSLLNSCLLISKQTCSICVLAFRQKPRTLLGEFINSSNKLLCLIICFYSIVPIQETRVHKVKVTLTCFTREQLFNQTITYPLLCKGRGFSVLGFQSKAKNFAE